MYLQAGCEIDFENYAPTPMVLMLRPRSGVGQWISQELFTFTPAVMATEFVDLFGNLCQRIVAPSGNFRIKTQVGVETTSEIDVDYGAAYVLVEQLPENILHYLLPSRYCQSDTLGAEAQKITAEAAPGYDQVEAIRAWIHNNFEYRYGISDSLTTAQDTLNQKSGVCRDFAHLAIALCRSLNIPARMVVGYLYQLEPMDQHAWFEAFVGNRWYVFDATQEQPRGGRIALAYGRDAADVAFVTQFGPAKLTNLRVWVEEGMNPD